MRQYMWNNKVVMQLLVSMRPVLRMMPTQTVALRRATQLCRYRYFWLFSKDFKQSSIPPCSHKNNARNHPDQSHNRQRHPHQLHFYISMIESYLTEGRYISLRTNGFKSRVSSLPQFAFSYVYVIFEQ